MNLHAKLLVCIDGVVELLRCYLGLLSHHLGRLISGM